MERNQRFFPGSRLSSSSVPTGLRPISTSSPFTMFCRREVSGPSGTDEPLTYPVLLTVGTLRRWHAERAARPGEGR